MTTPRPALPQIRVLSEDPIVTSPRPGESVIVVAVTYQADAGPPRTVWIDEDRLVDRVWRKGHPGQGEPPKGVVQDGDKVRLDAIRADLAKRQAGGAGRVLGG